MDARCRDDARPDATYMKAMSLAFGLLLFVATVLAMEAVAYVAHRWLMHGIGWGLHKSHHEPRTGAFEANDWYGAIFAVPSVLLIWVGLNGGWGDWALPVGAGISAYGAIYFGFHDMIVHGRVRRFAPPRSRYLKRIVQAHRLHHAVETREGGVSYGFLWAPAPHALKAELKRRGHHGLRAPTSGDAGGLRAPQSGDAGGLRAPVAAE